MRQKETIFTVENVHALITCMMKAAGFAFQKRIIQMEDEPYRAQTEHLNILVVRDNGFPENPEYIVITTKNDTYLLSIVFEAAGTDIRVDMAPRSRTGTCSFPLDYSMLNALNLYFTMAKAGESYIREHFVKPVAEAMLQGLQEAHTVDQYR